MNDQIGVRIEPQRLVVEAGGVGHLVLILENRTSIVDQYAIEVLGDPAAWSTVDTPRAAVMPQASTAVQVEIRPPRSPDPPAGTIPLGFRIRSTQDASRVVVEEGFVELQPFVEIEAELAPKTARGRFSAKHRLLVANQGNAPVKVSVRAEVQQGDCKIEVSPAALQIEPGARGASRIKVRPSNSVWQGGQEIHSYRLNVVPQGGKALGIDAMMRQLPIVRVPTAAIVAAALLLGGAYFTVWRGPTPLVSALKPPWSGTPEQASQPSPSLAATVSATATPTTAPPPPPPTSGPPPPPCVPGAPTAVSAVAGTAQATIHWNGPGGTCRVSGYTITASPGNTVAPAAAGATSVVVPNLTNCTAYTFVVDAIGSGGPGPGSAPSNTATPGAGPPGPPTGVTAVAGDTTVTLNWQAPANTGCGITSYTVTGTPGPFQTTATGLSATLTHLVDGTTYTFTVAAVNSSGTSTPAASNAVKPQCTPLSSLQLSATPYHVYWAVTGTCTPYSGTVDAVYTGFLIGTVRKSYPFSASGPNPSGTVAYCEPALAGNASFTVTLHDSQNNTVSGTTSYGGAPNLPC